MDVVLEVQAPWSEWLLDGRKSIETRRYEFPQHLLGQRVWILETPQGFTQQSALPNQVSVPSAYGKIVGFVIFDQSKQYTTQQEWKDDEEKHLVKEASGYSWNEKELFFGWKVKGTQKMNSSPIEKISRIYRSFFLPVLTVPLIDISQPYEAHVLEAVEKQCQTLGFLRVTWKDFPIDIVQKGHQVTKEFFDMSEEIKQKASKSSIKKTNESFCSTGYRRNTSSYNSGGRESWSCVRPDYDPFQHRDEYYTCPAGQKHFAVAPDPQVPWPNAPEEFKANITEYYATVENLGKILLGIFGRILKLDNPDHLVEISKHHTSSLNLTNLRINDNSTLSKVILPSHGDITSVTILSHDISSGASGTTCLEVANPFYDATIPYSLPWIALAENDVDTPFFLVNLGQIMERWSGGRLKANLHRIVKPIHPSVLQRRQALVYFQITNYDTVLEPLQTTTGKQYKPEIMSEYTTTRLGIFNDSRMTAEEAYAVYNKDIIDPEEYKKLSTF
ncbi:2OG-Fe(II) oxygenase [Thraustotheca clavata]|uniref:2OG-Fe(II) oxygenase n=1 Tax=Thraustotheca clavata TaxID=74557 RepID=A0A1V9ZB29_9STRA|nr:2OG-Fe(II) oxygenase [Thraustotheca clavata]